MQHRLWLRKHAEDVALAVRPFPFEAALVLSVAFGLGEELQDLWLGDTKRLRQQAVKAAIAAAIRISRVARDDPEAMMARISERSWKLNEIAGRLRTTMHQYESVIAQLPGVRARVERFAAQIEDVCGLASGNPKSSRMAGCRSWERSRTA